MSVTPGCFVNQAEKLCAASEEIDYRSSVSRAYYGLFHASKAWVEPLVPGSTGVGTARPGSHEELIEKLKNPARECKEEHKVISRATGKWLHLMRLQRRIADYELSHNVPQHVAENACARAREVMKDLV